MNLQIRTQLHSFLFRNKVLQVLVCLLIGFCHHSRACFPNPASNADWKSICGVSLCGDGILPPSEKSTASKVADVTKFILEGASEVPGIGAFANVGAGIINFQDGGDSVWAGSEMQQNMNVLQDYLVCKMSSLQKETITKIDQMFKGQVLDRFNSAMQAFQTQVAENCLLWNCLSEVDLPPSERSGSCAVEQKKTADECKAVTAWDPKNPVKCQADSPNKFGYCDPKGSPGRGCYTTIGWETMSEQVTGILNSFTSKDNVDNFNVFNVYSDPAATVAMAKGTVVKLLMLQQLFMLGEEGSQEQLKNYLNEMAERLQKRYDMHLATDALMATANKLSYGTDTQIAVDCSKPLDYLKNISCGGDIAGKSTDTVWWRTEMGKDFLDTVYTGKSYILPKQVVRPSCDESTFYSPTWWVAEEGFNAVGCSLGKLTDCGKMTDGGIFYDSCGGALNKCADEKMYSNLQANSECSKQLLDQQKKNIAFGVGIFQNTLEMTLAPVQAIIQSYRDMLALGGMNREYFGYFKNQGYPKADCSPATALAPQVTMVSGGVAEPASLVDEIALAPSPQIPSKSTSGSGSVTGSYVPSVFLAVMCCMFAGMF